jgi:cell division protein FtsB
MIDLSKLDPSEAERIAHAEGFTGVAALYARLSDAEHLNSANEDELDNLRDQVSDLEAEIEDLKDTLIQCLPFFEDWKDENGVYKPRTMEFMIKKIRQSLGESPT